MSDRQMRDSGGERLAASVLKAVGLHLLVLVALFVSFSSAPTFEPARPIVQATLVQLESQSSATTQTEQQIAGEAERTAAQRHEAEQLEQQRQAQEAAARAAEQQRQAAAAAAARQAEQQQAAEQQAAEERRQAEQVEQQRAAEAQRAEAARKRAEQEAARQKAAEEAAKRKAAEEARRKEEQARQQRAAEEARRKAEAEAAKAEAERVARLQREQEEARARALADLLAEEAQYQRAQADRFGEQDAASYDDAIRRAVSAQWRRPPTARNGMVVEVRISMLPTGDITDAVVVRPSGDPGFDQAAVQAVRNVGRVAEMQQLSRDNPAAFDRLYRQRNLIFKPEDLDF